MRSERAPGRFVTIAVAVAVAVVGFALSGVARAQTSAPASAPQAPVAPEPVGLPNEPAPGPSMASPTAPVPSPDYGYPPAYSPSGYAYPLPPPETMAGFHTHDGLYLHAQAGIGVTSLSSSTAGVKTTVSGGGASLGGAVGGVIARNLVLYGAFFSTIATNPDVQVGGTSVANDIGEVSLGGFGPGLAYYFEPINLYLSATIALARFRTADDNDRQLDSSKAGIAFELQVGKEWWVAPDWGLGIAAEVLGASMKDQTTPGLTWSAGGLSILFTATYN